MDQGIGQSEDGRIDWCIEVLVSQRMEELIGGSRYWSVRGWKNLLVYQGIGHSSLLNSTPCQVAPDEVLGERQG